MRMKALILALALSLLPVTTSSKAPGSIPVTFANEFGQVCPIGPQEALTAKHVAFLQIDKGPNDVASVPLRWGVIGNWNSGTVRGTDYSNVLDIARVQSDTKFPFYYAISYKGLKVGDKVTLNGYDMAHGGRQISIRTKVSGFASGVVFYDNTPGGGSSGSCVFNEKGEVVAINFGMIVINDKPVQGIGVVLEPSLVNGLRGTEEEKK